MTISYGGIAQLARAIGSYPIGRGFKSNFRYHGPLVKRLRHRPFTAVTGVRFPLGSPERNQSLEQKALRALFFWNRNTHLKVIIFLDRIGGQAPGADFAPGAFFNPTKCALITIFRFLYAKQIWYRTSDAWHSCTKHAFCKKSPDISYIAWIPAIVHNIDISLSLWFFCHLSFSVPLQRGT